MYWHDDRLVIIHSELVAPQVSMEVMQPVSEFRRFAALVGWLAVTLLQRQTPRDLVRRALAGQKMALKGRANRTLVKKKETSGLPFAGHWANVSDP